MGEANSGTAAGMAAKELDRIQSIRRDYGTTDFARQMIEDRDVLPHYAPEVWKGSTDDEGLRTSQFNWNAARGRWNDLSDAEKQIAVDDRKMALADYEKRTKEAQALSQASRIMDQRENASKASGGGGRRDSSRPLTGGYGVLEPKLGGAKTLLGM